MSRNNIPFAIIISCLLFSCGGLNQKPVNNNDDSSYLDVDSPWIETQERVPYYKTLFFSDGQGKEYLSQNDYETIIIIGHSEGGIIAPELYFHLDEFNISAIISSGAGGLMSPVDIAAARRKEPLDEESVSKYLATYNSYLDTYRGRYEEAPDELRFRQKREVFYPTIYQLSHYSRRPFNLYKRIDIPVLFIHGLLDVNVSPISTKYVEENLTKKPFDYIYYPGMQHYPTTVEELQRMRADVANWLREKGL